MSASDGGTVVLAALFVFAAGSLLAAGSMVHAAAATIRKETSARIFFIKKDSLGLNLIKRACFYAKKVNQSRRGPMYARLSVDSSYYESTKRLRDYCGRSSLSRDHRFTAAVQFITIVKGTGADSPTRVLA